MCIGGNQAFGITHTINFKAMTTINTDYSNTELLDQELNLKELVDVSGGKWNPNHYGKGKGGWDGEGELGTEIDNFLRSLIP
tara:strand:- start:416 stop:661 length:246 start_codon:yes stop_codon:yes gene_type:complete